MTRRLLPAAVLLLAALLLLIFRQEPAPGPAPVDETPSQDEGGAAAAPGPDRPEEPVAGSGRSELLPGTSRPRPGRADWRQGIPAFQGRVLLPDGSPAADARIEAYGMRGWALVVDPAAGRMPRVSWKVSTGADGRFETPESPADGLRFILRARHPNHPPLEILDLPARPGATRDLGDLRLQQGFSAGGVVLDGAGLPVPGAVVRPLATPEQAVASRYFMDRPVPLEGYEARSDGAGRFLLRQLPPGRLRIQADAGGYLACEPVPVRGAPGEKIQDLALVLEAAGQVEGLVLDPERRPVEGARLLLQVQGITREQAQSGADGTFRLDLTQEGAGRPVLEVLAAGYLPLRRPLRAEDGLGRLELQLDLLAPVRGVVVDEGGEPVAGAAVALIARSNGRDDQVDPAGLPALARALTAADGSFALQADPARAWDRQARVAAWAEGLPLAPAWSPFLALEGKGGKRDPLRLVLRPGLEVHGWVLSPDGTPGAGARVQLRRLRPAGGPGRRIRTPETRRPSLLFRATGTDATGAFQFTGVPSGDYVLEAFHPDAASVRGEEFPLLDAPHEERLQLMAPGVVEGDVVGDLDLLGPLRVTASSPLHDDFDASVDGRGHFLFPNLPPDAWTLVARELDPLADTGLFRRGAGQGLARAEGIEVAPGSFQHVTLLLDLADRARVEGVVQANGQPRADLAVYLAPADLSGVTAGDPRLRWRTLAAALRVSSTDYRGAYRFMAVDPGEYWLVVAPPGVVPEGILRPRPRRDGQTPEGPAGLARLRLTLREGAVLRQDVEILAGSLSGRAFRMRKDERIPVRGGEGRLEPGPDLPQAAVQTFAIGRDGRFQVELIPAGTWDLRLRSGGLQFRRRNLGIGPGGETTLRPVLEPMRRRDTQVQPRDGGQGSAPSGRRGRDR